MCGVELRPEQKIFWRCHPGLSQDQTSPEFFCSGHNGTLGGIGMNLYSTVLKNISWAVIIGAILGTFFLPIIKFIGILDWDVCWAEDVGTHHGACS